MLSNGTRVRLPDGSEALAYRDCAVGRPFSGRYITAQVIDGIERRAYDWPEVFLTPVISDDEVRQLQDRIPANWPRREELMLACRISLGLDSGNVEKARRTCAVAWPIVRAEVRS